MSKRFFLFVLSILSIILFPAHSFAEDLGVKGRIYKSDPSGADQLRDLASKRFSGPAGDQFWSDYRRKTIDAIKHPAPLNVPTSFASSVESHSLDFVFRSDFRDENGKILVTKGTTVSPLTFKTLLYSLVFIDGRDERQIKYALSCAKKGPIKIILTAGSPYDLRVRFKDYPWLNGKGVPFYFDQKRMILNSFKNMYGLDIKSVPVKLTQQKAKLIVSYGDAA